MVMKTNGTSGRRPVGSSRKQMFMGLCVGILIVVGATRAAQKASKGSLLRGTVSTTVEKETSSTSVTVSTTPNMTPEETEEVPVTKYLTIIDAGSSGCRAHVFSYSQTGAKVEVNPQHKSYKVRPGLSSYADNPSKAGESVVPLLDFIAGEIPEEKHGESPIFLKATAGLRLVEASQREAILTSVSQVFATSQFAFNQNDGAKVIPGTEEGGFGWMSVNFLLDTIDKDDAAEGSVAVVEMGGASAQVTMLYTKYASEKTPNLRGAAPLPEDSEFDFDMNGDHFDLYAHSYLGYGLEKAREQLSQYLQDNGETEDPCINSGFTADPASPSVYDGTLPGSSDAAKCADLVTKALFPRSNDKCPYDNCSNIQNAFQPPNLDKTTLLVFENFFYTYKMLGGDFETPQGFDDRAPDVCNKSWDDLTQSEYPKDGSQKSDLNKLCFSAVYLPQFLQKGLKLPADESLKIQQGVGDFDIDWSLGAAIREANHLAATDVAAAKAK